MQKQAAAELKLLDDDAQQVLAMFASNMAEPSVPKQAQQAAAGQLVAGRDITNLTNRRKQVSSCSMLYALCHNAMASGDHHAPAAARSAAESLSTLKCCALTLALIRV